VAPSETRRPPSNLYRAALKRGKTPEQIKADINAWLDYCKGPKGATIRAPGFFVAKKIREGEQPPAVIQSSWYTPEEEKLIMR
jgi:hypothetical protein